jgi:TonB family protein
MLPTKHCETCKSMITWWLLRGAGRLAVLKLTSILLSSITLYGSAAWSQTPPLEQPISTSSNGVIQADPLVAYRSYTEAVIGGHLADAARFASEAWQAAEVKWGSANPNTAGLAYNAAWSAALIGKSAERLDAARRAVDLARTATDSYTSQEAQFLLAYAEFFATNATDRPKVAAKLAAAALPVEGTWNDYLIVNALVTSANIGSSATRGRNTAAIAERALAVIDRIAPSDSESKVMALFARAQGRLTGGFELEEAVADLIQARVAYGPIRRVDDKSWGSLAAWEMAARSVALSVNTQDSLTTGTRIARTTRRPLSITEEQAKVIYARIGADAVSDIDCSGVTRDRGVGREITYPANEEASLRVAGVVLRADMDANGHVINARLLGAVPEGRFGDNALAAVRTWKYKVPANVAPQCLRDRDIGVSFAIG